MILREELIEIGIYNKSHGIAGEISASFLCELGYVASFSCLVTEIEGIFVPFFVESSRGKGSNSLLLKLEGINDEVGAKQMTNKPIYVKKSEYEALQAEQDCDEMPIDFFIGYSAQDSEL